MSAVTVRVITRCVTCSTEVGPVRRYCARCREELIDHLLDERMLTDNPTGIDHLLTQAIANRREV